MELFDGNAGLFERDGSLVTSWKKSIAALKSRKTQLEDEIFNMRMNNIRIKGQLNNLVKEIGNSKLQSKISSTRCVKTFTKILWNKASYPKLVLKGPRKGSMRSY